MKKAITLLLAFSIIQTSYADVIEANYSQHVTYLREGDSSLLQFPEPKQLLKEILSVTGLLSDFELKAADVLNIQASVSRRKRLILYNPEYINWLNQISKDKWSVMALLAHEVGHHLNGHTIRKGGSSPLVELEADEFAGFTLYKLGATLEESQKVMNFIAGIDATETHPGRMARMKAIQTGWEKASGVSMNSASR